MISSLKTTQYWKPEHLINSRRTLRVENQRLKLNGWASFLKLQPENYHLNFLMNEQSMIILVVKECDCLQFVIEKYKINDLDIVRMLLSNELRFLTYIQLFDQKLSLETSQGIYAYSILHKHEKPWKKQGF